jgi:hypothetical protein
MLALAHIFALLAVSYGFALIAWPLFRAGRTSVPFVADLSVVAAILAAGFMAWDQSAPVRALVAISGIIVLLRVHSYGCSGGAGTFGEYVHFLSFGLAAPHLIYSPGRLPADSHVPLARQWVRLSIAVLLIPVTWKAASHLLAMPWSVNSWMVNHLILAAAAVVVMSAFGQCATVIWQIQGSAQKVLVDNILLSRTPAEFWRRWSWPMHLWLYRYVYIPAGGKANHVRATLMVFFVSGLLHEFIAALAIGRVTGHQMLFFLVSGAGVLVSPALEKIEQRGAVQKAMGHVLTLSFLVATSSLMFATLDYIVPVYYKHVWLLW